MALLRKIFLQSSLPTGKIIRWILGIIVSLYLVWRLIEVILIEKPYGPDTWLRFAISGLIVGGLYSLIAIGYTLVYGILQMINFAHGDVMMIGSFGGYFVFEALKAIPAPGSAETGLNLLNYQPVLSVILAFIVGMAVSALAGYYLEKIAYRPLRSAPRLIPLISAIGASIFLENAFQLLFGPQKRIYTNPDFLERGVGWYINIGGSQVVVTYTGALTFALSVLLMVGLYLLVQKTRLGRSMRAVSQDKKTASLMGIDVDNVISKTFIISGALAGAAGVMFGIHTYGFNYYVGFLPGIKAFTAAVVGGIGNIPGAMVGGLLLGVIESMGPSALGLDLQLSDVIAFTILILVLIFRPSGILGRSLIAGESMIAKSLRYGVNTGITFSVVLVFMILIGFTVTGAALVSKALGTPIAQSALPEVIDFVIFLIIIGLLGGITAARRENASYLAATVSGLSMGIISGILTGIVAYILGTVYANGIDLRTYLSEVSPEDIRFLNFDLGPATGSLVLLGILSASGAIGGLIAKGFKSESRKTATKKAGLLWKSVKNQTFVQKVTTNKWVRYTVFGLILIGLGLLPTQWGSYWNYVMGTVGIYVILGLGLNIIVGLSGQLVLGFVAYFAVGAYALALLNAPQPHNLMWGFWIGLVVAIVLSAIAGILTGLPILNLRGDYLAIVTLGFGEIIRILLKSDAMTSMTGGPRGVLNISGPVIFGYQFSSDVDFMYLILIGILITIFITQRIQNSNTGRSWISIREDETVAKATGVDTFRSKLLALALGAAFAGIGGALFAARSQSTGPDDYGLMVSINVLCLVIVGGMGSIPGIILGSFVLKGLPELLRELDNYRLLVFGALLIAMMIIRPEGIWPPKRRTYEKYKTEENAVGEQGPADIPPKQTESLSTSEGEQL